MSKYSCFEVQINDGIAHLIMNRPDQLNSMTRIFWKGEKIISVVFINL